MQVILNVSTLKAALSCVSTEETRYYLRGVYLNAERKELVSTDGHRMAVIKPNDWFMDGEAQNVIISTETIKAVIKNAKLKKHYHGFCLIDTKAKTVQYIATNLNPADFITAKMLFEQAAISIPLQIVDGTFPDYIRVVPTYQLSNKSRSGFNMNYLGSFSALGNVGALYINDETGPSIITFKHDDYESFAVLMPVRTDFVPEEKSPVPEWFTANPALAHQAAAQANA